MLKITFVNTFLCQDKHNIFYLFTKIIITNYQHYYINNQLFKA